MLNIINVEVNNTRPCPLSSCFYPPCGTRYAMHFTWQRHDFFSHFQTSVSTQCCFRLYSFYIRL